jgi:hypothetical protein
MMKTLGHKKMPVRRVVYSRESEGVFARGVARVGSIRSEHGRSLSLDDLNLLLL